MPPCRHVGTSSSAALLQLTIVLIGGGHGGHRLRQDLQVALERAPGTVFDHRVHVGRVPVAQFIEHVGDMRMVGLAEELRVN